MSNRFQNIQLGCLQICNKETLLGEIAARAKPGQPFWWAEIGLAGGQTTQGVVKLLDEIGAEWRAVGVDIEGGWCLNKDDIQKRLGPFLDMTRTPETVWMLEPRRAAYFTCGSEQFFKRVRICEFNAVHIDGCHATTCAARDFLVVDPHVAVGGIAIFHDADVKSQGDDYDIQPHCGLGIGVRRAVQSLDLLNGKRPGWRLLHDITPNYPECLVHNKAEIGVGAYCRGSVIVEKVAPTTGIIVV